VICIVVQGQRLLSARKPAHAARVLQSIARAVAIALAVGFTVKESVEKSPVDTEAASSAQVVPAVRGQPPRVKTVVPTDQKSVEKSSVETEASSSAKECAGAPQKDHGGGFSAGREIG
jgi:hypothetical protein